MGRGTGRVWRVAALIALLPGGLYAQAADLQCREGVEPVGSLGITGIACERCQFFTNGKVHRAVFWTEPTITGLSPMNPAAAVLREGDVLVAVDGRLITTREGSARFSSLPVDQAARLRVRRDGRLVELTVPVAAECPKIDDDVLPVIAGRGLPIAPAPPALPTAPSVPSARPPRSPTAPTAPTVRAAPALPALPAAPAPPALAAMAPRASLGFGFQCSDCSYHVDREGDLGRWLFPQPPEVVGVDENGRSQGLRVGDALLALNGTDITTAEGGRRFSGIEPGQTLEWTVLRDGRRVQVTTRASERASIAAAAPALAGVHDPATAPLRFAGTVGNTTVEVRGGRVSVTEGEGGRLVVIRTGDTEIRIRAPGGGEGEGR